MTILHLYRARQPQQPLDWMAQDGEREAALYGRDSTADVDWERQRREALEEAMRLRPLIVISALATLAALCWAVM